jgi:D-serine deaminase-like pyridoxal phosphate-dependent protein
VLSQRLTHATADLDPPLAALDVAALQRNALDLVHRAGGKPIRVATKSVRCRWVLEKVLARQGFRGLMCYSLAEALWLVGEGFDDVLMGYPTADRSALRALLADPAALAAITLMIDHPSQLDFIAKLGRPAMLVRMCLDIDASLRIGRAHLGVRRSPLRTPDQAVDLANDIAGRPGFALVGAMFYEAQIAGLPDSSPAVALVKRRSLADLAERRSEVVNALQRAGAELEFVNSGGTGSLEVSSADDAVTELTAGSGLYGPTLFDGYRQFSPSPAMFFALPVVRRPAEDIATLYGGGYLASGPAKKSRLPQPLDDGFELLGTEGAGEVQTPVRGSAATGLKVGDRVWFRHAKAGEMLERFDTVHLVEGSATIGAVPSYRGEGRNFG